MGLSQVYGYVKQSRGHIKIYPEIGQGTTVKIYLPRAYDEVDREEATRRPAAIPTGSQDEVILLVEGDDRMRELGYTVIQSPSGSRALQMLATHPQVQLLFTDNVMPDMGGWQFAEEALRLRPT